MKISQLEVIPATNLKKLLGISVPEKVKIIGADGREETHDVGNIHISAAYENEGSTHLDIDIDGFIGGWWGILKSEIKRQIDNANPENITLKIDSYGGDVHEAYGIHDLLASHSATVTADYVGMSASAATIIACAADKRIISENVDVLIHEVWGWSCCNAEEIKRDAAYMEKLNNRLAKGYKAISGKPIADIRAKMKEDTWMTAAEAKKFGLVDEVYNPKKKSNSNSKKNSKEMPDTIEQKASKWDKVKAFFVVPPGAETPPAAPPVAKTEPPAPVENEAVNKLTALVADLQAKVDEKEKEADTKVDATTEAVNKAVEAIEALSTRLENLEKKPRTKASATNTGDALNFGGKKTVKISSMDAQAMKFLQNLHPGAASANVTNAHEHADGSSCMCGA